MVKDIEGSFSAGAAGHWWMRAIIDRGVRKIFKTESLTAHSRCAIVVDPEPRIAGAPLLQ
jgi:hypothetical protein